MCLRQVTYTKTHFGATVHNIFEVEPEVTGISSYSKQLNALFDMTRHKHTNVSRVAALSITHRSTC